MATSSQSEETIANLRAVYQELCTTYRAIDDFRAKLLGFLPLVSGAGVFFLLGDALTDEKRHIIAHPFLEPIGLFGCAITLGLFAFEIYGIKKCHAVIRTGQLLEDKLGIETKLGVKVGQFLNRPQNVIGVVNEPFAAGVIYPAVFAAWLYLVLLVDWPNMALMVAVISFFIGLAATLFFDFVLRKSERQSERGQSEPPPKPEQIPQQQIPT